MVKQGQGRGKQGQGRGKQGGRGREIGQLNINNSGFEEILATWAIGIINYTKGDKKLVKY